MIDISTKMKDVIDTDVFYNWEHMIRLPNGIPGIDINTITIAEIGNAAGWMAEPIADGLNYLVKRAKEFSVYRDYWDSDEKEKDISKKETGLVVLPTKTPGDCHPFIVLVAGGAYKIVCSLVEAYSYAERLNERGYTVFVVKYRTDTYARMPNPLDDLAQAISYILDHAEEFHVDPVSYAVCGASAGGHLTALFGTKSQGYARYGIRKPACLILAYPVISYLEGAKTDTLLRMMTRSLGDGMNNKDLLEKYSAERQVDADYPPTYLWQCMGDKVVPIDHTVSMVKALERNGVPYKYEAVAGGEHGWGIADGTPAQGWLKRAVMFWETQITD